jgi:outer membrane protein OmpA-like peptidoglycan-associated protein
MTIMKAILKVLLTSVFLVAITLVSCYAQDKSIDYIPEGRYLVIGSFHIKSNAIGFADYVRKMGKYEVKVAYHPVKKFYHVYIKGYGPNEKGLADVDRMRKETEFIDTWFMVVEPYDIPQDNKPDLAQAPKPPDPNLQEPAEEPTVADKKVEDDPWIRTVGNDTESTPPEKTTRKAPETKWVKATTSTSDDLTDITKIIPETYAEKGVYKLYFNTFYTKNFKEIKGPVEIINPKTLRLLRVVQSLELVKIPDPNNGEHSVQLIANIFGYKKVQHDIILDEPFDEVNEEFFHFKGDTLVADFPLRRYDMGDIATMYNVFFFKDAAIMKPISKFELNSLLDMLKENDNLKVKIHGHTNGNERGKIITMAEGSENFFTLNQELVEDYGTAKALSLARAEVIKRYLISYGINADRMEVIGWGGKKPIYDKMDKLAIKNVRVEIEILEN